jgi:hypothetical protein
VLLDVAANFASEHGVPGADGRAEDRERWLRRAARQWPLLEDPRPGETTSEDEVVELLRAAGASELLTSYVPGEGSPAGFYARLGFVPRGDLDPDGEVILRLPL